MNKELVSVIVPIYNCEKYVGRCIEGIINQSYDKLEILLLNDGSKDNSKAICERYAEKDKRIKVLSHDNMGASKSRKRGVQCAEGEYIVFIDSDDSIEKDYIERLYHGIVAEGADMCCCNCIDEGITNQPNICIEKDRIVEGKEKLFEDYFDGKRYAYVAWSKMYRKEVLLQVEYVDLRYTEDTYMMLNLFQVSNKVKLLDYAGYHYIYQEESLMAACEESDTFKDSLVTGNYLCRITENVRDDLFLKAKKQLKHKIWGFIATNIKENKRNAALVNKEMQPYYSWLKASDYCRDKKGIGILLFKACPGIAWYVLKLIYILTGRVKA